MVCCQKGTKPHKNPRGSCQIWEVWGQREIFHWGPTPVPVQLLDAVAILGAMTALLRLVAVQLDAGTETDEWLSRHARRLKNIEKAQKGGRSANEGKGASLKWTGTPLSEPCCGSSPAYASPSPILYIATCPVTPSIPFASDCLSCTTLLAYQEAFFKKPLVQQNRHLSLLRMEMASWVLLCMLRTTKLQKCQSHFSNTNDNVGIEESPRK